MKRKLLKYGAPSKPLTSYNYFYKDKTSQYSKGDAKAFLNFQKETSIQYSNLTQAEKSKYAELALKDRIRFDKEMNEFKKTDNYTKYLKSMKSRSKSQVDSKKSKIKKVYDNKIKTKKPELKNSSNQKSDQSFDSVENKIKSETNHSNISEIPIFTKQFLEHNQQREELLRNIKKQSSQLEEQTALLSKHLDNLNNAIDQSNNNINKFQDDLILMDKINAILDHGLINCLSKLKPPTKQPNLQINKSNIPLFISTLRDYLSTNPETEFVSKLKDKMKNLSPLVLSDLKKL